MNSSSFDFVHVMQHMYELGTLAFYYIYLFIMIICISYKEPEK
jgi:hypothetical protein